MLVSIKNGFQGRYYCRGLDAELAHVGSTCYITTIKWIDTFAKFHFQTSCFGSDFIMRMPWHCCEMVLKTAANSKKWNRRVQKEDQLTLTAPFWLILDVAVDSYRIKKLSGLLWSFRRSLEKALRRYNQCKLFIFLRIGLHRNICISE